MVFTFLYYQSSAHTRKSVGQMIASTFEEAHEKISSIYGDNLISIIYEVQKNSKED